ncbi:Cys-tRNA(Pro) deacylase [Corynebacterium aquilae]|uniref:Cys-tRNA(Pro)/Cys-tRNA(Cys) deacylase n=1 Tax=Corynebacterium aquilae DSM 44791 TaxID=1431546 RepID=A0A1L7CEE8_9CORY|nr:Cys-tRNA(Pro) deacylase [Corynebacterium aquilae]APT84205.1 hypothetical protein CAQU_02970 [Corynebacterium aquilae DSM 44791]
MKKKPGGTPALQALNQAGIDHVVHEFDAGNEHFGQHAAAALAAEGISENQVFKTLVIELEGAPRPGLGVVCIPVGCKLSMKKAAAAFNVRKAHMAEEKAACRATGYVFGGTSPIGQKTALPTVIDESVEHSELVCVSAGKRGMDVGLSPKDLALITGATFAPLTAD